MIALRKTHPVMVYGDYQPAMEEYENVVAYTREFEDEKWLMTFNFQAAHQEIEFPEELQCVKDAELLMCNYPPSSLTALRPYEGRIYRLK